MLRAIQRPGALNSTVLSPPTISHQPVTKNTLVTTSESQDKMQRGAGLNLAVGNGLLVLELLSGENQTLLGRRNSLQLLNLFLEKRDLS